MAHGHKDYGAGSPVSTVHGLQDMGELAGRLWSPNTFHRLGNVMFMDGFEGSLNKWETVTAGAGGVIAVDNEEARNGLVSCHLTAGSDLMTMAVITHHEPISVLTDFGLEASLRLGTGWDYVYIDFVVWDGAFQSQYRYQHVLAGNVHNYYTTGGVYAPFANGQLLQWTTMFHTIKMVVNTNNRLYRYIIIDDILYPLTGLPPDVSPLVAAPRVQIVVLVHSTFGLNGQIWVDDVILTQNEP